MEEQRDRSGRIVERIECAMERREGKRGRKREKERRLSEKQKRADRIEGVAG